jgi:two-component system, NarL family, nitrate/nitrite response regulator NarL
MRSVSIIVADDHPVVLRGLVTLLNEDKTFKIVASCTNGSEAIDAIRSLKPDIALLDLIMPDLHGLQVLKAAGSENLTTRIIFLAASPSDKEVVDATAGGAYGIILKESAPDSLISCLHAVAAGEKWLPATLVDGALARTLENHAQIAKVGQLLTRREIEVMLKVAEGLPNKEVGSQLNISEGTVKIHLHSIYNKVGVSNRTSLANFAVVYRDRLAANKMS